MNGLAWTIGAMDMKVFELTIEEAWLYMPKPLKALIRFMGMLMVAVVIVLCAI
jgi:hypothetical protein